MAPRRETVLRSVTTGARVLIGREKERRLLGDLMGQRKNVLILGAEGVGKSAILEKVVMSGPVKNILYSKRSTTLKETLVNLVGSTVGGKELQKKNILSLKKTCYQLLDAKPEYAVLDQIGWLEPKFYGFLTYMKERNIPFIIATRKPGKKNVGHLWMGLYDYETVEIRNLDAIETGQFVDCYAAALDLKIDALADFRKEIFKYSGGNPKIIRDLCQLARNKKFRAKARWT